VPGPTAPQILAALSDQVPEIEREGRWPATIVFDAFADHVADRVRHRAPADEVEAYFAFVEELASSGDPATENLVVVDVLEAVPWGRLGAAPLLGPATAALAPRAGTDPLGEAR
jgi:hypothetical protein